MRKIYLALLITLGLNATAQISFIQHEYVTISGYVDPSASVKEKGLNFGGEIQLISHWKYVKAGFQSFDALEGGYLDYTGAFGVNLTSDIFEETRYYAGLRLGFIQRGYKLNDSQTYPLAGLEAGFDYQLTDSFFVGLRTTADWREDFMYSGANPEMVYSGFVICGIKFD